MLRFSLLALALAGSALAAPPRRSFPIEPVAIPPSIQQGIDLLYIDPELAPANSERDQLLEELGLADRPDAAVDLFAPISPIYTGLRRSLQRYRSTWSALPQVLVEPGPTLRKAATGPRVAQLRERMGLAPGDLFDADLEAALRAYQNAHRLGVDGLAGPATIASLNLGARHYEQLLMLNMERARRLPGPNDKGRYILIDVGEARLFMFEDGRLEDSMKVIVGKQESPTPMMASMIRYASVNPYWNVPPDLAQSLVAPRILNEGLSHLRSERYEVMSDWSDDAVTLDPASIDWNAVARGDLQIRLRQLPGPRNSMGAIKFMMPNDFGIYLHDTPNRHLFDASDRWISNGCVRVEDARRLARWLFGSMPQGNQDSVEEDVNLQSPVPVYITYLTAVGTDAGAQFRPDPYDRDSALLATRFASTVDNVRAGGGAPLKRGF